MFGSKILEERTSKFNGNIRVVRTLGLGTYIQVEGLTQSGGVVWSIWKSVIKKIKKIKKENIESALVLGLGGGTVCSLLKKYWPGVKITGVDIDPLMIELGKKYLNLEEVKIKITDAYDVDPKGYDLVIVDIYRGSNFPSKFESNLFLKKFRENKMVIFNRLNFGEKKKTALEFGKKLEKNFQKVEYFSPEANLMFLCYNS